MPTLRTLLVSLCLVVSVALLGSQASSEPPRPPEQRLGAESATQPVSAALDGLAELTTTTTVPPTTTTTQAPTTTTQPEPAPEPVVEQSSAPASAPSGGGDPNDPASWERLCGCETGYTYDWATNTGNGYYGGIQFSLSSWQSVGGTGYPHEASKAEQIHRGQLLWQQGGWNHWPGCAREFGWI